MTVDLVLHGPPPCDVGWALAFLGERAIDAVEAVGAGTYARAVRLAHGDAAFQLEPRADGIAVLLDLDDERDRAAAIACVRRLLDLDADPVAVDAVLALDPLLAPLVAARPGLRAPGAVGGDEIAVRALLGQQISVRAARTHAARLTERLGEPLARPRLGVFRHFPTAAAIAVSDPAALALPRRRTAALIGLCAALAEGDLVLAPAADAAEVRSKLTALAGIGPWTAEYIAMRALGDRDAWMGTDLGVRHALARMPGGDTADPERWRPYRTYAVHHLWATLPT